MNVLLQPITRTFEKIRHYRRSVQTGRRRSIVRSDYLLALTIILPTMMLAYFALNSIRAQELTLGKGPLVRKSGVIGETVPSQVHLGGTRIVDLNPVGGVSVFVLNPRAIVGEEFVDGGISPGHREETRENAHQKHPPEQASRERGGRFKAHDRD